jgi:hypothetical protein
MNKILALTLAMAFASTAHAQTTAHPKGAASIVNKASAPAQDTQGNTLPPAKTSGASNATKAPGNGVPNCIQADAPKNGTTGAPCHPTKAVQL